MSESRIQVMSAAQILPSIGKIEPQRLLRLFAAYEQGLEGNIPPLSARKYDGKIITLDGPHRGIIADLLNEPLRVFVAHSSLAYMQPKDWPAGAHGAREEANHRVGTRFDTSVIEWGYLDRKGLGTYRALREHHGIIDADSLRALLK